MYVPDPYISASSKPHLKTAPSPIGNSQGARQDNHANPVNQTTDDSHEIMQKNLLQYKERYRETGKLDFIPFEIVAEMAAEGTVFVPDYAEQQIQKISASAQSIRALTLTLQSILLETAKRPGWQEAAREALLSLNEQTLTLTVLIEQIVLPVASIVSASQKNELDKVIHTIKQSQSYFIDHVETAMNAEKPSKEMAAIAHRLTQLMSKVQFVAIVSITIIKARVPFYRLSA